MTVVVDVDCNQHLATWSTFATLFPETFTVNGVFKPLQSSPLRDPVPGGPIYVFDNPAEYAAIHKAATEKEFELECEVFKEFNDKNYKIKAWMLTAISLPEDLQSVMFLMDAPQQIESFLPKEGLCCRLILTDPNTNKEISMPWAVERVPNQFGTPTAGKKEWQKYVAFKATVADYEEGESLVKPLLPRGEEQNGLKDLVLSDSNSVTVHLKLQISEATYNAEIGALDKLKRGEKIDPKQQDAFRYIMDFKDRGTNVNLFDMYPHMSDPTLQGSGISPSIVQKYQEFNLHQKRAYHGLLSSLPCGIGFLTGGPGAGKTNWTLATIAMLQCCPEKQVKVLYLLDINKPLDDTIHKYILMLKLSGKQKLAIRLKNFGYELKNSQRFGSIREQAKTATPHTAHDPTDDDGPAVDYSKAFLPFYEAHKAGALKIQDSADYLPTLDEAAWCQYENEKEKYAKLTMLLENSTGDPTEHRSLRWQIWHLYEDVLHKADFIAATPCVASTYFSKIFKPNFVVMDEAAHARELTTLIPIAHFSPDAWFYLGDHLQTLPSAKSEAKNPYTPQLRVSMMERASVAGAITYKLLINHRALGNLHRLASRMFYNGEMISAVNGTLLFTPEVQYVQGFFERYMNDERCQVPRVCVQVSPNERPVRQGTSWHSPVHLSWVMARVLELVADDGFRHAKDPEQKGTILLISPYKAAVRKYSKAIEVLDREHPKKNIAQRVEARTFDICQGHEADIIGIDWVRSKPTEFMDGKHRMNVGLTRALVGEFHMIHPRLKNEGEFWDTNYLKDVWLACGPQGLKGQKEGHRITVNPEPAV